ncbi:hypothetical protein NKH77_25740 [Streptomyces sp. M19]
MSPNLAAPHTEYPEHEERAIMSTLQQAMLINAVVLIAVLEADLGPHRKIGPFRVLRPLLMSAAIVPSSSSPRPRTAPVSRWRWPPPWPGCCWAWPRPG